MAARSFPSNFRKTVAIVKAEGLNPNFLQIDGAKAHPPLGLSFLQCPSIHCAE